MGYTYNKITFTEGNILYADNLNNMQDYVDSALTNIDKDVKTISGKVSAIESEVGPDSMGGTLRNRVQTLEEDLANLETSVGDLSALVGTSAESGGSETIISRLNELESTVGSTSDGTTSEDSLLDKVGRLEGEVYTNGSSNIAALGARVTNLETATPKEITKPVGEDGCWDAQIVYGNTSLSSTQTLKPGQIYLEYV